MLKIMLREAKLKEVKDQKTSNLKDNKPIKFSKTLALIAQAIHFPTQTPLVWDCYQ